MEDGMEVNKKSKKATPTESNLQWSQWQLLDSLLPTGGFAHSLGLEAAIQARLISVGRKASIAQGSALMRVGAAVFSEIPALKSMRDTSLGSGVVFFHHAPIFGLICGLLGLDSTTSQRAYLFITMRDVVSAATRLNLVGPLGAAVLQHRIAFLAESILEKWVDRTVEEACQTSPLLDTVQGCHGYLFSRLFCS